MSITEAMERDVGIANFLARRQPREISDRHGRIRMLPVHAFLEQL